MKTPHEKRIEEVEQKLKAVTGKAVFFKDKVITIKSFKIFTKAVTIITTETSFSLELHLVEKYLEELSGEIPVTFSPIDTSDLIKDDDKPIKHKFQEITPEQLKINDEMENQKIIEQSQEKENQLATTSEDSSPVSVEVSNYKPTKENAIVKETLMEMLKKVSTNPGMIPQAKAVCDIANTMVNIQKNEIQMIQMVNKIKA
ncbi:hypothetical protein CLU81_3583 [Flavobacterium sp. 9]|uniref:hypothetical protein n=1 Tax=Flavobacterium sp. 9 TaxID=2035198 RepID=UPI000C1A2EED|nr:hypothetical protein [Flavobacterium sp. 9]PIF33013.1 hypothetical protein CLU81_3583 [Flavobacterium sp. 9]